MSTCHDVSTPPPPPQTDGGSKYTVRPSRLTVRFRFLFSGSFPLSPVYCIVWITLDVLFCTSSILHMCTLSVDRYLSLRYPIKYGRNKTKRRVVLKLCLVWMTSVAMSVPLSLMYSRDDHEVIKDGMCAIQDHLYMTIGSIISFYIPLSIMLVTHALTLRLLKEAEKTKMFTVISNDCSSVLHRGGLATSSIHTTTGSIGTESPCPFRQPSSSCSYSWKRLLSKTYSNVSTSTDAETSDTPSTLEMQRLTTPEETPRRRSYQRSRLRETQLVDEGGPPCHAQGQIPLVSYSNRESEDTRKNSTTRVDGDGGSDSNGSEEVWVEVAIDSTGRTTATSMHIADRSTTMNNGHRHLSPTTSGPVSGRGQRYSVLCCGAGLDREQAAALVHLAAAAASSASPRPRTVVGAPATITDDSREDMVAMAADNGAAQSSSSTSATTAVAGVVIAAAAAAAATGSSARSDGGWDENVSLPRLSQGSDECPRLCEITIPTRTALSRSTSIRRPTTATRQGRFLQSERKATKVLGIIFFTFVILWAPFFSLNIVCGLCPSCSDKVSPTLSYVVQWLGYASSTVNPIFYTIFNPTFRQTFVRLLTFQCKQ